MPAPLSRHQTYRLRSLGLRLRAVIDILDVLPDRRLPLMPAFAGLALRAVSEARRFANLPPHGLRAKGLAPGELFAETLSVLDHLTHLKHQDFQASSDFRRKSYPRAAGLE